jgi:hypothetical protein
LFEIFKKSSKPDKTDAEIQNVSYNPNNEDESNLAAKVTRNFEDSRAAKGAEIDELGYSIEEIWEDEEKLYKGGGLQWATNLAYRTKRDRQIRPNSEDNFVFNTLTAQNANITINTPEVSIQGVEYGDREIADKVTFASRFNDERNKFKETYKKIVHDFTAYGPAILMVYWDSKWEGGTGPNRWIGDVRVTRIKKRDFFPDPAVDDLEENLQEGTFHIRRLRKKIDFIKSRWGKRGKFVTQEARDDDDEYQNEGSDPQFAYVYEYWHRGYPEYMPKDRAKELKEKALRLQEEGDFYKAQDYFNSAKGELEGIHLAYISNNVVLEYVPYFSEHGKYPFEVATCYYDENCPWGFGEVRNIKIPQVLHNKADEIEIEAMSRQGLGGKEYQKGAINPKQLDNILKNAGKGGMYFEVDNVNLIKDRTGVNVPASVTGYKEHKQRVIETVSQVTATFQGRAEYANMPYKAIAELGARTDTRTKKTVEKLEDLLVRVNKQRVALFAQYYTEDRYYRIKGTDGKMKEGTLRADDMYMQWDREPLTDNEGNFILGEDGTKLYRKEKFVPEFDIKVTILSEKPTDRNYYTSVAFEMFARQLMTGEDLWYTIEEGKFPCKEDILKHLYAQDSVKQLIAQIGNLPPEIQQQVMQVTQQSIQSVLMSIAMSQQGVQQGMQQGMQQNLY